MPGLTVGKDSDTKVASIAARYSIHFAVLITLILLKVLTYCIIKGSIGIFDAAKDVNNLQDIYNQKSGL